MDIGMTVDERDGWLVVGVDGDLDLGTVPHFRQRLVDLAVQGFNRLVIDLGGVGLVDSAGLGVLLGALRRARSAGGDVVLVCQQERTVQLLQLCGLDRTFRLVPSVEEAVAP